MSKHFLVKNPSKNSSSNYDLDTFPSHNIGLFLSEDIGPRSPKIKPCLKLELHFLKKVYGIRLF